jgi:lipoprotein-releasing system ATP-binding protein
VLRVQHLTKSYATPQGPLVVLDDVSFELASGESAAVMGPSGSGKSTLLNVLGTLDTPTSGVVTLDGRDPFTLREPELAAFRNGSIGFVFQDHALLPQCTMLENVLAPTLVAQDDEAPRRARELLERVGLGHRLDHRPSELSGGEKQRAAIARALIRRPRLLLCDEPTGNLDGRSAEAVASVLVALHEAQRTVLMVVTHSRELAERFGRRFDLHDGHLAERDRQAGVAGRGSRQ